MSALAALLAECSGMDTNAWDVGLIAVFGLTVVAVFWIMRRYR